jgi:hypothetical protein
MDTSHHRSFSELLNSFMEESNIRWGEIIGGLLIIGCSVSATSSVVARTGRAIDPCCGLPERRQALVGRGCGTSSASQPAPQSSSHLGCWKRKDTKQPRIYADKRKSDQRLFALIRGRFNSTSPPACGPR